MRFSCMLVIIFLATKSTATDICDYEDYTKIVTGLVTDQIRYVGGTIERLLDLMYSHCVTEEIIAAVDKEELEDIRQTYEGFKDTLEHIRTTGQEENVDVMFCFFMDLNNEHFKFAENDLGNAVVYFRDYAVVKITTMKILITLNPDDSSYQDLLMNQTQMLVQAGRKMISEAPKAMWEKKPNMFETDHTGIERYRQIVKNHLAESIKAWHSLHCSLSLNRTMSEWDTPDNGSGSSGKVATSCSIIPILCVRSIVSMFSR